MTTTALLIIDPQIDFCSEHGRLPVKGACDDMLRLGQFIKDHHEDIDEIHVTMDMRHDYDIAFPSFWKDAYPGLAIRYDDVMEGRWLPASNDPEMLTIAKEYTKALEQLGKVLIIEPPHCIIGERGGNLDPVIMNALRYWETHRLCTVNNILKGMYPFVEHRGAFAQMVGGEPDWLNMERVSCCDRVIIAGEASSHCVRATIEQMYEQLADEFEAGKFIALMDCMSPMVTDALDFSESASKFFAEMEEKGLKLADTGAHSFYASPKPD